MEWTYVYYKTSEETTLRKLCSKYKVRWVCETLDSSGYWKVRIEGNFDAVHNVAHLFGDHVWNGTQLEI